PSPADSAGRVATMCDASNCNRSRTALPYSARFKRARPSLPGFGLRAYSSSSAAPSACVIWSSAARGGRGLSAGGIMPVRTLRMTISQVSASLASESWASRSKATPPAKSVALWQSAQYSSSRSQSTCESATPAPDTSAAGGQAFSAAGIAQYEATAAAAASAANGRRRRTASRPLDLVGSDGEFMLFRHQLCSIQRCTEYQQ